MKVAPDSNGLWGVFSDDGAALATGLTNSQAWRERDRLMREPLNKSQDTADWAFSMKAREP